MYNVALNACWDTATRDATEIKNDGMIKMGDVHYQTEPNLGLSTYSEGDLINDITST